MAAPTIEQLAPSGRLRAAPSLANLNSLSLGDLERAASSFEQFGTSEEEVESLFKLSGRETTERLTVEDLRTIMGIAFPSSIQEGGGTGKGKGKAKGRARGGARGNGKSATG